MEIHLVTHRDAQHREHPSSPTRRSSDRKSKTKTTIQTLTQTQTNKNQPKTKTKTKTKTKIQIQTMIQTKTKTKTKIQTKNQRSAEHTSELQSHSELVCRLLLEKKNLAGKPCGLGSLKPAQPVASGSCQSRCRSLDEHIHDRCSRPL